MPKKKKKTQLPTAMVFVGVLIIVSAVFIAWYNSRQAPLGETPVIQDPGATPGVQRVSLSDARSAHQTGEAVFLDVRSVAQFQASHINGALSIPLEDLSTRVEELDPDSWIITYCT